MEQYVCRRCNARYPVEKLRWRCDCGDPLDLVLDSHFPVDRLSGRPQTIWRYKEALPNIAPKNIVTFDEGFTPLTAMYSGRGSVHVKLDYLLPSGSFKDRGAAILISKAKDMGIRDVVIDSSGNAAASVACYSAKAGIRCRVFVPESTSAGKLVQMQAYGADVVQVPGSREDTANAVLEAAQSTFYASHYWNPYFFQGTKTFAYEVWEQLGQRAPDTVVLPAGNGTLLLGAYYGFSDLRQAGVIERLPRLVGVQAETAAPVARAWSESLSALPEVPSARTIAEGIAVVKPPRWRQMIAAVQETNGKFVTVTDDQVKESFKKWAALGVFMEPTSATVFAAHESLASSGAELGEIVVLPVTGTGLKAGDKLKEIVISDK